jgi:hypothetical protein
MVSLNGTFIYSVTSTGTAAAAAISDVTVQEVVTPSLQSVLHDPNATLEEFWAALFREARSTEHHVMTVLPTMQVHHWTIVLPWGISLLLGVVVPCLLSTVAYFRSDDVDPDDPWVSRVHKQERRLSRLIMAIKDHRKVWFLLVLAICFLMYPNQQTNLSCRYWKILIAIHLILTWKVFRGGFCLFQVNLDQPTAKLQDYVLFA